jgi:hypothetical protein
VGEVAGTREVGVDPGGSRLVDVELPDEQAAPISTNAVNIATIFINRKIGKTAAYESMSGLTDRKLVSSSLSLVGPSIGGSQLSKPTGE